MCRDPLVATIDIFPVMCRVIQLQVRACPYACGRIRLPPRFLAASVPLQFGNKPLELAAVHAGEGGGRSIRPIQAEERHPWRVQEDCRGLEPIASAVRAGDCLAERRKGRGSCFSFG